MTLKTCLSCAALVVSTIAFTQAASAQASAPASSPVEVSPADSASDTWFPPGGHAARLDTRDVGCRPEYPLKAIKARAQGTTRLLFTVDATGKLVDARIVGSAGDTPAHQSLDRAALDALSTCPTTPGTDAQGQPVLTRLLIMYIWKIA